MSVLLPSQIHRNFVHPISAKVVRSLYQNTPSHQHKGGIYATHQNKFMNPVDQGVVDIVSPYFPFHSDHFHLAKTLSQRFLCIFFSVFFPCGPIHARIVHERQSGTYTASRFTTGAAMAQDPMMSDFMDYYLVHKSESHKFIRMADDLHDVASYLNEMRICFLLLTGTVYLILAIYFVSWCVRRNHRHVNSGSASANRQRGRWDLQGEEYQNAISAQTNIGQTSDDLVSVRSDGALPGGKGGAGHGAAGGIGTGAPQFGMGGRAGAANRQAPSFMRHSGTGGGTMQNHRRL
uniref:Uncharacterized protein n=1 Tax=Globodera rostochiensis TaxID=31243 RepID=A0A914GV11_GLORO